MTGFIKIEVSDLGNAQKANVEVSLKEVSFIGKVMLLDAFLNGLEIDRNELKKVLLTREALKSILEKKSEDKEEG